MRFEKYLLLGLSLLPSPGYAQVDTTVIFVNGVLTLPDDAPISRDNLRDEFLAQYPGEAGNIQFTYTYNDSYGSIVDFYEATQQLLPISVSQFLRYVAWLELQPDAFIDAALEYLADAFDVTEFTEEVLARLTAQIESQLSAGRKVILVPHSQGNFFVNEAYERLSDEAQLSVGIVSVATPANVVGDPNRRYGFPYTTSFNDLVIQTLVPNLLPWNVFNLITTDDLLGHNFRKVYLRPGMASHPKILGDIITVTGQLAPPAPSNGTLYSQTTDNSGTIYLRRDISETGWPSTIIGTFATDNRTYPIDGSTVQITVRETSGLSGCTADRSLYVSILKSADTTNGLDMVASTTLTPPYGTSEYRTHTETLVPEGEGRTHPYFDANQTYYVNIHSQCSGGQADIMSDASGERFFGYIRVGDSFPALE